MSTAQSTAAAAAAAANNAVGTWGHPAGARDTRLQKTCKQFEGVLLNEMLKSMRRTVPEGQGLLGHSNGERTAREMFDERLSEALSGRGALNIGKVIYGQMAKRVASSSGVGGESPAGALAAVISAQA
jgi:flagellar protein FlgJ